MVKIAALLTATIVLAAVLSSCGGVRGGGDINVDFVRVDGGTFLMGTPEGVSGNCWENERPTRNVTVSGFYIGRYLITQAQWRAVTGRTQRQQQSLASRQWGHNISLTGEGDRYPVYLVSFIEVIEFINRKSVMAGREPAYEITGEGMGLRITWNREANGYRLPTEAEWEFAARGGRGGGDFEFAGSDVAGEVAWYPGNSGDGAREVGLLRPNALGLYDMSGNVMEWVWDLYSPYPDEDQVDPVSPGGTYRVTRGGSWYDPNPLHREDRHFRNTPEGFVRVASRTRHVEWNRHQNVGFRLVRPL